MMVEQPIQGVWLIALSFFVAFILSIVVVPEWMRWAHPEWVAMVLIYWVMMLPHRIGVLVSGFLGLLQDIFEGAVLGEHAFAMVIVCYATYLIYQRLRMFAVWQQSFIVFVLIGLQQLASHWVENVTGSPDQNLLFLLPALMSALFWPIVMVALGALQRSFAIS